MKKFSQVLNENESLKTYKYTATVEVEGTVRAHSEGEAGELMDKELDKITSMVSYQPGTIEEVESPVQESVINMGADINVISEDLVKHISESMKNLSDEERLILMDRLFNVNLFIK
jgi:hypothetical protein